MSRKPKIIADTTLFAKVEKYIESIYDLQYNEVANTIEAKKKDAIEYTELNDNNLYRELQLSGIKISLGNLAALLRSDFVPTINPFRKYFEDLPPWKEGDNDHITELAAYVKARDQEEFNHHFKKMLVRTVVGALDDAYYNKHAFILVGKRQNSGKSTFIRFLCPPVLRDYIHENLNTIDKDGLIALSENLIINIDELAILGKSEINNLKAFLSRDRVKIRHPFDKKPKMTPRRASFFGSTNNSEFLSDETGSVRWLCFEIESIDWAYMKVVDIDKVYAQAQALWKSGFKYQLSQEDIERNEARNKTFQKSTIEYELIQAVFKPGTKEDHLHKLTATEVLTEIGPKFPARTSPSLASIGRAMTALGFIQGSERIQNRGPNPIKVYYVDPV